MCLRRGEGKIMNDELAIKNYEFFILIFIILSLGWPNFVFSQEAPQIKPPETMEEVKAMGERFLEKSGKMLPGILKKAWQEEILPVWKKMYQIWSSWWDFTIQPWLESIWYKIKGIIIGEVEKRKPQLEEEFQKEKEELKEEIKKELPKAGQSLWERFKELIQ